MLRLIRNTFVRIRESLQCGHLPVRLLTIMAMVACYALGVSMWLTSIPFCYAYERNSRLKCLFILNQIPVSNDYRNRFAIWMDDRMRDVPEVMGVWGKLVFNVRMSVFLGSGYLPIKKEDYNVTSAQFKAKSMAFYRRFSPIGCLDQFSHATIFQPQEDRATIEEEFARQNTARRA